MPEYPLLHETGVLIAHVLLSGPRGSRLARLAIDTGATTTMIPPKTALAIGVNPARAIRFRETITASGKELIPIIVIPSLKVFEQTLRNITLTCHALPQESPIDGLLGLDVLTRIGACIDLGRDCIRIP